MSSPEEWYRSLPAVTRGYMTAALGTTVGVQLQLLPPTLLFLDFSAIFGGLELWRLLTNFIFFGPFGFPFVMSMFFLVRYTKELEVRRFEGRTGDFVWAMFLMGMIQAAAAYMLGGIPFLSQAMLSALVYVWSREYADTVLSVFGLFNVQGFYWPWVLVALRVLMGGSPIDDLIGIFSGHVYYFLEDVQVADAHHTSVAWLNLWRASLAYQALSYQAHAFSSACALLTSHVVRVIHRAIACLRHHSWWITSTVLDQVPQEPSVTCLGATTGVLAAGGWVDEPKPFCVHGR